MELPSPVARLVPSLVLNAVVTFENPHAPKDDTGTGPLVSFARSGIAAHWEAIGLPEHLRTGRSVRRSGPLVLPDRGVP